MDKSLARIVQLGEEISKGNLEKAENDKKIQDYQNKIQELQGRNKEIESQNLEKQKSRSDLAQDRYNNKKIRKELEKYGKKSDLPEVAVKIKKYEGTDSKDLPEDIIEALITLDKDKDDQQKNTGIHGIISNISDFFIKGYDDEEDVDCNDN